MDNDKIGTVLDEKHIFANACRSMARGEFITTDDIKMASITTVPPRTTFDQSIKKDHQYLRNWER